MAGLEDLLRAAPGDLYDGIHRTPGASGVLADVESLLVGQGVNIAVVGPVDAGKTKLINDLFGAEVGEVALRADTTTEILALELATGVILVDTPGTSGREANEAITAAYLGISCSDGADPAREIPVRRLGPGQSYANDVALQYLTPGSSSHLTLTPNVVLFCIHPEHGGLLPADTSALRQLLDTEGVRVIVVATQEGRFPAADFSDFLASLRFIVEEISPDVDVLAADGSTGRGMDELVACSLRGVHGADLQRLNDTLAERHRRTRGDLLNEFVRRAGARGACITPEDGGGAHLLPAALVRAAVARVVGDLGGDGVPIDSEDLRGRVQAAIERSRVELVLPDVEQALQPLRGGPSLKEIVFLLPRLLKLLGGLALDARVSSGDKALVALAAAYVVNPFDAIPDAIPFWGQVDDVLVVAATLARLVARSGWEVVLHHWDGDPTVLRFVIVEVPELVLQILPKPLAGTIRSFIGYDILGDLPDPPKALPEARDQEVVEVHQGPLGGAFVRLLYDTLIQATPMAAGQRDTVRRRTLTRLDDLTDSIDSLAQGRDESAIVHVLQVIRLPLDGEVG